MIDISNLDFLPQQNLLFEMFKLHRFKNLDSSRNSLNPTLRPNSDDSLCHVIDSCKIFGST